MSPNSSVKMKSELATVRKVGLALGSTLSSWRNRIAALLHRIRGSIAVNNISVTPETEYLHSRLGTFSPGTTSLEKEVNNL